MKIGVFGPHGRLGSTLVAMGCDPLECDISVEEQVKDAVRSCQPDVLINAAAFTSVDAAELPENQSRLIATNVSSLRWLYKHSGAACLIHISTDYVFGGRRGPYTEKMKFIATDLPVNEYGKSKMAAEAWLRADILPFITIVRTTGLFGVGKDFVSYLLEELRSDRTVTVVRTALNQTYIPFLARDLIQLSGMKDKPTVLHLASQDMMSRYEFSKEIALGVGISTENIVPASGDVIPWWIAKRPQRCGLTTDYSKYLGFPPYTVSDGITEYIKHENNNHNPVLQSI